MKKIFFKEMKNNLINKMKENNFILEGQSFVRLQNKQILQIVNFQGSSYGDCFTVNIGVVPICSQNLLGIPSPTIRIGQLLYAQDKWWDYTIESVKEVADIIKNNVLLLLNRLSDYESLYKEIQLSINDIPRENKDWSNPKTCIYYSIGEESIFWLSFRNKDYKKCRELLKNINIENSKWLNSCIENVTEDINNTTNPKYKKIFEQNLKDYIELANKKSKSIENLKTLLENNGMDKLMNITDLYEIHNLKKLKKYIKE